MPWCKEPMKDVADCDKLRGGAEQPLIRRFLNGVIQVGKPNLRRVALRNSKHKILNPKQIQIIKFKIQNRFVFW